MTLGSVSKLVPPGFAIWEDDVWWERWQVLYKRLFSVSRSWKLYGRHGSLKLVLEESWRFFETIGGYRCLVPGILSE